MSLKYVDPENEAAAELAADDQQHAANERLVTAVPVAPYFTYILVASLIAVFLTQIAAGLDRSMGLADSDHALIRGGEYWRLFTGATMHLALYHLFFNGMALFNLGRAIEYLSHRAHLAIVFFFSVAGGALLSLFLLPDISAVGASGGIVGLLGYLAVYGYKRRKLLPPSFMKNMLLNLGILAAVGIFGYQYIDNGAHLGGLLIGAAYGFIQISGDLHEDPRKADALTAWLGYACLAAFLGFAALTILLLTGKISL
jgi:rhomboid protease GluP